MKTEKTIRAQTREALKGNWTAAVSGVFVVLAVILIVEIVFELLCSLTGIISDEKIQDGKELYLIIILFFTILLAFALTPIKNGYFRLCYNIACGRSDGLRDMFYFFSGIKLYFKALGFNVIILLKKALGFIPYILFAIVRTVLEYYISSSELNSVLNVLNTVFICLSVTLYILISIRMYIYEFVFTDNCEADVLSIAKSISKNHLGDYYRLVFTFLLWLLSCIFVLPGLYVIPYFTTALGTSSKWLINMYKEGKTV